ncbi:UDP-2,3-diacylglucosamine hydrolase [gamma proteobacterium HdN1]|nr:UDP-2,3-diacylglucosamine hydrolase [gamma proteobacterium HdN1]
MDAIFISDLHLQDSRPELTDGFVRFCETWGRKTQQLFILGDLFEVWIGDDVASKTSTVVQNSLARLAGAGVKLWFIAGNRDFLLGKEFAQPAGLHLLADGCIEKIAGNQVLLSHGDVYCTDDVEYQNFRKTMRDPRWICAFLQRPAAARQQMAAALRQESKAKGSEKAMYLMDVNRAAIDAAFEKAQTRLMIHGHTHRPAIHTHNVRGQTCKRVVLGDWGELGWMATIEGASTQLLKFPLLAPEQVSRCET